MTLPDSLEKTRNILAATAVLCAIASFSSVYSMAWWAVPLDYWLAWLSFATGFGAFGTTIATIAVHIARIDALRSN